MGKAGQASALTIETRVETRRGREPAITRPSTSEPGSSTIGAHIFVAQRVARTVKIRLIEDGNFPSWLRLLLILVGTGLAAIALECKLSPVAAKIVLLLGFGIALVGGMTSRAALLKIKPFDNRYKKAKDSYKEND